MIPEGHKNNFDTMMLAAQNGDLCLAQCADKKTGNMVLVICATFEHEDGDIQMVPMARMFESDPYEEVCGPDLGEGQ